MVDMDGLSEAVYAWHVYSPRSERPTRVRVNEKSTPTVYCSLANGSITFPRHQVTLGFGYPPAKQRNVLGWLSVAIWVLLPASRMYVLVVTGAKQTHAGYERTQTKSDIPNHTQIKKQTG